MIRTTRRLVVLLLIAVVVFAATGSFVLVRMGRTTARNAHASQHVVDIADKLSNPATRKAQQEAQIKLVQRLQSTECQTQYKVDLLRGDAIEGLDRYIQNCLRGVTP